MHLDTSPGSAYCTLIEAQPTCETREEEAYLWSVEVSVKMCTLCKDVEVCVDKEGFEKEERMVA